MTPLLHDITRIAMIGIGATLVMDFWLWGLKRLKVRTLDFALVGRWVGHLLRGRWWHAAIAQSPPVRHERALGWFTHYAVGIGFAALLVAGAGMGWLQQPTLALALAFGLVSAGVPLFVMQPAMGAGFASSRTPTPVKNCIKSLVTHTVFGVGLFLSASLIERTVS